MTQQIDQGAIPIETPENVCFTFAAAGVGPRALAYMLDLLLRTLPILAAMLLLSLTSTLFNFVDFLAASNIMVALFIILVFLLQWAYYVLFETFWNGRTPGKRVMGIRVVMDGGYPLTFAAAAVRNLLRIIDSLPMMYCFAILTSFINSRSKRLGDIAAGTIVIREEAFDVTYLEAIEKASVPRDSLASSPFYLSPEATDLIARFMKRRTNFDVATRMKLASNIAAKIHGLSGKTGGKMEELLRENRHEEYLEAALSLSENAIPKRGDVSVNRFVKTLKDDWLALAQIVDRIDREGLKRFDRTGLDRLTKLYRRVGGDLAYSKTFFGNTDLTRFLNALMGRAHNHVYRTPRRDGASLKTFFTRGFPLLFQKNLRSFSLSLYIFLAATLLGIVTVAMDERSASLTLGDSIIESVREHKMWTREIFSVTPHSVASAGILTNNITVSFMAFGLGLAAGTGAFYVIFLNGMMFGQVLMLTAAYGMSYDLWSFVGAHGFIELFIIILAGGAGLKMGISLLAPGDLMRSEALKEAAKEGVQLILGGAVVLIVAGIVEGFISPIEEIPGWIKIIFGLALLAMLLFYLLRPISGKPVPDESTSGDERLF